MQGVQHFETTITVEHQAEEIRSLENSSFIDSSDDEDVSEILSLPQTPDQELTLRMEKKEADKPIFVEAVGKTLSEDRRDRLSSRFQPPFTKELLTEEDIEICKFYENIICRMEIKIDELRIELPKHIRSADEFCSRAEETTRNAVQQVKQIVKDTKRFASERDKLKKLLEESDKKEEQDSNKFEEASGPSPKRAKLDRVATNSRLSK